MAHHTERVFVMFYFLLAPIMSYNIILILWNTRACKYKLKLSSVYTKFMNKPPNQECNFTAGCPAIHMCLVNYKKKLIVFI